MNRRHHLHLLAAMSWAAAAALVPTAARAQARGQAQTPPDGGVEFAGVRLPGSVPLGGQSLRLNGAGIRYRFVVRVYVAGLYLTAPASTTEAVLATPGPKRLQVHMLREIDANDLGRLFTRGMQDNAPRAEFSKSIPGTLQLAGIFAARKRLREGDSFSIDFVPGTGTQVLVNGRPEGAPIKEPEFFNALMRIWLGDKPADEALKAQLLGAAPPQAQTGQN